MRVTVSPLALLLAASILVLLTWLYIAVPSLPLPHVSPALSFTLQMQEPKASWGDLCRDKQCVGRERVMLSKKVIRSLCGVLKLCAF
jgi:hypothetical protein